MSMARRVVVLWMGLLAGAAQNVHAWRATINGNADKHGCGERRRGRCGR